MSAGKASIRKPLLGFAIFGVIALFACVTCVLPASGLPGD